MTAPSIQRVRASFTAISTGSSEDGGGGEIGAGREAGSLIRTVCLLERRA
jgi:hypothetical protein